MKVAIYAIVKDEEKNIKIFLESLSKELQKQDVICILDTGSKDTTFSILQEYTHNNILPCPLIILRKEYKSFRFDVARNDNLNMVPDDIDICISLDADETLTPGFRTILEQEWEEGLNKLYFPYIYSWEDEKQTIPNSTAYQEKTHSRHGYIWKNIVHERLEYVGETKEKEKLIETITLIHHPDTNKERNYLPLCIKAKIEDPYNYWISNYLAQEYRLQGNIEDSIKESLRFLQITSFENPKLKWTQKEKQLLSQLRASIYIEIADMMILDIHNFNEQYKNIIMNKIFEYSLKAIGEAPYIRDNWIHAAEVALKIGSKDLALEFITFGEKLTQKGASITFRFWNKKYLDTLKLECMKE